MKNKWNGPELVKEGTGGVRFAPVSIIVRAGAFYRNGHGDICGPMERRTKDVWLDQHGAIYHPDGRQWNHTYDSTGNLMCLVSDQNK